jgi:hypothetical protein
MAGLSSPQSKEIDFEAKSYFPVSISLMGNGSIVAQLIAFVQAKYFGSAACHLTLKSDDTARSGRCNSHGQIIECVPGRPWSRDTQPLTFEFVNIGRSVVDFSLDASFHFIAAFFGYGRGVLWDRTTIGRRDLPQTANCVRDVPDVRGTALEIIGPKIDVQWALATDPLRHGKSTEIPHFRRIVDVRRQLARDAGLTFFKLRLFSCDVVFDDATSLQTVRFAVTILQTRHSRLYFETADSGQLIRDFDLATFKTLRDLAREFVPQGGLITGFEVKGSPLKLVTPLQSYLGRPDRPIEEVFRDPCFGVVCLEPDENISLHRDDTGFRTSGFRGCQGHDGLALPHLPLSESGFRCVWLGAGDGFQSGS